jgi:signal transduction histidine kinase
MSKKRGKGHVSLPPNLKQLVQHKEKARDKEVARIKSALENVQLINQHTLAAMQSMLNLLTSFVGHDIKNEIHNIDGIVSTVGVNEISEKEIESIKSCLDNMRAALEDFKSITDDKEDKEKEEFTLSRLISSLMVLHRNNFKRDKINFFVDFVNLDKDFQIKFHFRQFLQLLNNLLINAYKALKSTEIKEIKLIITNFDDSISFKVCDTGIGITEANKEKIFEPYFSTTGGSGVGLTHVQFVLTEMKGKVELIDSDPYYKTVFNIIIPKI